MVNRVPVISNGCIVEFCRREKRHPGNGDRFVIVKDSGVWKSLILP